MTLLVGTAVVENHRADRSGEQKVERTLFAAKRRYLKAMQPEPRNGRVPSHAVALNEKDSSFV